MQNIITAYYDALFDTDRERALAIIDAALDDGVLPEQIIFDVVVPTMERMVGGMTSDKFITLSQHFLASQIAEEVTDRLVPRFSRAPEKQGKVVIGTSHGDFHGLGKKIVAGCLRAKFYEVIDLGINVRPERFVAEAISSGAGIIGISSMMVHTAIGPHGPRRIRRILRDEGLEERIKMVVGGAPYRFDEHLYEEVEADGWAESAAEAPGVIAALLREVRL